MAGQHAGARAGTGSNFEPVPVERKRSAFQRIANWRSLGVVDMVGRPLGSQLVEQLRHTLGVFRFPFLAESDRSCQLSNRVVRPGKWFRVASTRMGVEFSEHVLSEASRGLTCTSLPSSNCYLAGMGGAPLLPVLDIGTTLASDGERLPTVVVDTTNHPQVADLARVHAIEGIGDISTEALCVPVGDGHQLLLGVRVSIPVRCTFALGFTLPAHRPVLDDAATTEQLVIATTDPTRAGDDQPHWLAITIDKDRLLAVLPPHAD